MSATSANKGGYAPKNDKGTTPGGRAAEEEPDTDIPSLGHGTAEVEGKGAGRAGDESAADGGNAGQGNARDEDEDETQLSNTKSLAAGGFTEAALGATAVAEPLGQSRQLLPCGCGGCCWRLASRSGRRRRTRWSLALANSASISATVKDANHLLSVGKARMRKCLAESWRKT